jgi:hypothetical protein
MMDIEAKIETCSRFDVYVWRGEVAKAAAASRHERWVFFLRFTLSKEVRLH